MNYYKEVVWPLENFKKVLGAVRAKGGRTFRAKDINQITSYVSGGELQTLCDLGLIRVIGRQKEVVKIETGYERAYVVSHETGEVFDDLTKISKHEKDLYVKFDTEYKNVQNEYNIYSLVIDNMADAQNMFIKNLEIAFSKVR